MLRWKRWKKKSTNNTRKRSWTSWRSKKSTVVVVVVVVVWLSWLFFWVLTYVVSSFLSLSIVSSRLFSSFLSRLLSVVFLFYLPISSSPLSPQQTKKRSTRSNNQSNNSMSERNSNYAWKTKRDTSTHNAKDGKSTCTTTENINIGNRKKSTLEWFLSSSSFDRSLLTRVNLMFFVFFFCVFFELFLTFFCFCFLKFHFYLFLFEFRFVKKCQIYY